MLYTVLVVWSNIAAACKAHFGLGSLTAFIEITSGKGCSVHLLSPLTNTALHVRFKNVAASSPEPHRLGKKKRSKLFIFIFFFNVCPTGGFSEMEITPWSLPCENRESSLGFHLSLLFLKSSFLWSFKSESSPVCYHQRVQTFPCICPFLAAGLAPALREVVGGWQDPAGTSINMSPSSQVAFPGWASQRERSVLFWVHTWPYQGLVQNKMTNQKVSWAMRILSQNGAGFGTSQCLWNI